MIYCVIPRHLADELYEKMVEYYKDNPNVKVIIDRRDGPNRRSREGDDSEHKDQRVTRDRRRQRATGTFLPTDDPEAA